MTAQQTMLQSIPILQAKTHFCEIHLLIKFDLSATNDVNPIITQPTDATHE